MDAIGRRLRTSRRARDITQVELAERAGVAHSTVVRIERGRVRPQMGTVWKFAEILAVDPKWLAFGDDEPEETSP